MKLTEKQITDLFKKHHTAKHDELSLVMDCEDFKRAVKQALRLGGVSPSLLQIILKERSEASKLVAHHEQTGDTQMKNYAKGRWNALSDVLDDWRESNEG